MRLHSAKSLFAALLLIATFPTHAKMQLIADNDDVAVYFDVRAVLKDRNVVRASILYDYKHDQLQFFQGESILSIKTLKDYDCGGSHEPDRVRVLKEIGYRQRMGEGEPAYSVAKEPWRPMKASLEKIVFRVVCSSIQVR